VNRRKSQRLIRVHFVQTYQEKLAGINRGKLGGQDHNTSWEGEKFIQGFICKT